MNKFIEKTATELQYTERSVFRKEVNTQSFGTFELGTQEDIIIRIWIFVVLRQSQREHDESLNNGTFRRLPVTIAQGNIGNERYPDCSILSIYDYDDAYAKGYGQIKEAFRALTKDNILEP